MNRFRQFAYRASNNHTKTCWVLKCDIKKFFASIDHEIFLGIAEQYIPDGEIMRLLERVVESFSSIAPDKGLPLGNLTSQLFANMYMNEFDRFMKHDLKAEYYIRYADDFVILSDDREWLADIVPCIHDFLREKLRLTLHPNKVFIKTFASSVDFLGWVHFPHYRVLRTATKRRIIKKVRKNLTQEIAASYMGLFGHGNAYKLKRKLFGEEHKTPLRAFCVPVGK